MTKFHITMTACMTALGMALGAPAYAQDAAAAPDTPAEAQAPERKPQRLDEIVVTAQKRAENVQDVPISVSVVTAERLKDSNMQDFEDVALATPNTNINMTPGYVQVGMRGLNAPINDGMEQSVGFYVDGIYYGKTAFLQDAFLDIGRVEMLKGPQGTLFGKNTIAGAIAVHTAQPAHEWMFDGTVSGGEFEDRAAQFMINAPIMDDTFALRVAGTMHQRDGYVYNSLRDVDEKIVDKAGIRAKALFEPTSDIDLTLTLYAGQSEDNGQGWEPFLLADNARVVHGAFDPTLEDKADFVGHANEDNITVIRTLQANVTANWDLGQHTLTFIGGWGRLDENFLLDGDTASAPIINWANNDDYQQYMGEFRVVSAPFDTFLGEIDYIAGLFGFYADYTGNGELRLFPDEQLGSTLLSNTLPTAVSGALQDILNPLGGVLNPILTAPLSDALFQTFAQETTTYAAFGQLTWRPITDLAFVFGLRGSMETKDVNLVQRYEDTGLVLQGALGVQQYTLDTSRDESNVAPKFSIKYDLNDDIMIYATYGEGFKAGGFNPIARNEGESTFNQELSTAYELGAKITALDGTATINMAIYHTQFDDMQIQSFIGNGFIVRNAAAATTQGIEVEANWLPFEGAVVYAGGGYTDATFDSFTDGPCISTSTPSVPGSSPQCDVTGKPLPRAPEFNFSGGFNAGVPLGNTNLAFIIGGDALWQGDILFDLDQDPIDAQEAYWLFNARLGIADIDGAWRFVVHGKNIADETIKTFSADLPVLNGSHMGFLSPPRIITAEFSLTL
ncbi:MAG: TonB-dependent receptor [Alphaproteobacteria bacterium]